MKAIGANVSQDDRSWELSVVDQQEAFQELRASSVRTPAICGIR